MTRLCATSAANMLKNYQRSASLGHQDDAQRGIAVFASGFNLSIDTACKLIYGEIPHEVEGEDVVFHAD